MFGDEKFVTYSLCKNDTSKEMDGDTSWLCV